MFIKAHSLPGTETWIESKNIKAIRFSRTKKAVNDEYDYAEVSLIDGSNYTIVGSSLVYQLRRLLELTEIESINKTLEKIADKLDGIQTGSWEISHTLYHGLNEGNLAPLELLEAHNEKEDSDIE